MSLVPRDDVLVPRAVGACGTAARALARRALAGPPALAHLRGVTANDLIVLVGEGHELPWTDGVIYFGIDARAPRLFLPTPLAPNVAPDLFERAVLARAGEHAAPVAVFPSGALVPLGDARTVDEARLRAFAERAP